MAKKKITESILLEAETIVNGERQSKYGPPAEHWGRVCAVYNALTDHGMDEEEAMLFMLCLKLVREGFNPQRDNLVDICGYAEIKSRISEGR